jgi:hypothetical protein
VVRREDVTGGAIDDDQLGPFAEPGEIVDEFSLVQGSIGSERQDVAERLGSTRHVLKASLAAAWRHPGNERSTTK